MGMITFGGVIFTIFLAIFAFSALQLAGDNAVSMEIKNNFAKNSITNPVDTLLFIKTLDEITPTLEYKLPFTDKVIFGVNQLPMFSYFHVAIIIILFFIWGTIIHFFKVRKSIAIIVFLLLLLIGYFAGNFMLIFIFEYTGAQIGLTGEDLIKFRTDFDNKYDDFLLPALFIATLAFLGVLFSMVKKMKRAK